MLKTTMLTHTGHVAYWQILLQKSFWGDERNFLEPLMRFTSSDVKEQMGSSQNRPGTSIVALKSDTAAEDSKDQLSRDFLGRSIFGFCNNIGTFQTCRVGLTMSVDGGKADLAFGRIGTSLFAPLIAPFA